MCSLHGVGSDGSCGGAKRLGLYGLCCRSLPSHTQGATMLFVFQPKYGRVSEWLLCCDNLCMIFVCLFGQKQQGNDWFTNYCSIDFVSSQNRYICNKKTDQTKKTHKRNWTCNAICVPVLLICVDPAPCKAPSLPHTQK